MRNILEPIKSEYGVKMEMMPVVIKRDQVIASDPVWVVYRDGAVIMVKIDKSVMTGERRRGYGHERGQKSA
ncbi:MAG: hypothetical protein PHH26_08810 [Candidatus Thermoplasmatota archaeon]|nr:hypothetical protein [Candidatus Thermoplasmatota archaeon]